MASPATYTLANDQLRATFLDFGARLARLDVHMGGGQWRNVVYGFDAAADYLEDTASVGAIAGRFANRIRNGQCALSSGPVQLTVNNGQHHLHGGPGGFGQSNWGVEKADEGLLFSLHEPDGHEGYPGNLTIHVDLSLERNTLVYRYIAVTDAETVINVTNHTYFNLAGGGTIRDHRLQLAAGKYLPVDHERLPTGEIAAVDGTAFDFTVSKSLGRDLDAPVLAATGGFDHCFVLDRNDGVARLEVIDLALQISTTEPGLQLYTANSLPDRHTAVCLETQHFPDSPNHSTFPSTVLRPGETFESVSRYCFEVISPL